MHRTNTDIDQFENYQLGSLEKHLLNDFQHGFPLVSRPYQMIAEKLGVTRQTIISIESGRYTPSLPLAFKISELFKKSVEEIFIK